jgi:hypothetical protein
MQDDNYLEEEGRYAPPPPRPNFPAPFTSDPGPNYNGGVAPIHSDPYHNYNGGSPVDAPLQAGYGWEWAGPSGLNVSATFNPETKNYEYGTWQQVAGRGIGYTPQASAGGGSSAPTGGGGAVPSMGSPVNVPSSTLPPDILSLFNRQPSQTPVQSAYQDALLKFMGRSQETPSLNDSVLGPQTEVYRAAAQRGQERNRRAVAERAAAHGQSDSGFLDTQINKGIQEQNFNTAAFNANLLGGEMNKRREELMAGLQLARATGDAESERELRTRLAQVSAAMQQQGLNLQGQLGMGDLDLRWALGTEGLNQQALQLIMNGTR